MRLIVVLIVISLSTSSCQNSPLKRGKVKRDITQFEGSAYVFFNLEMTRDRVYIIPSNAIDKKKIIKEEFMIANNPSSIQVNLGRNYLLKLEYDKNKQLLREKICCIPYDSMYYSKVYIKYANYKKVNMDHLDQNNRMIRATELDSCNTWYINETDSSSFTLFKVY